MSDIIDFRKYVLEKNKATSHSEQEAANEILQLLNYDGKNIAIPIVKIAKNYGLKVYREDLRNAAGKLIVGKGSDNLYGGDKVIIVNFNDHIFEQRIVVARILGYYLMDAINKKNHVNPNTPMTYTLDYERIYSKYEAFVLNILAPNEKFVEQYNIAVNNGLYGNRIALYLSKYFEVSEDFVQRKVKTLTRK